MTYWLNLYYKDGRTAIWLVTSYLLLLLLLLTTTVFLLRVSPNNLHYNETLK
jgi:hypothetical protein